MNTDFLTALRTRAAALNSKIHTAIATQPDQNPRSVDMHFVAELDADSAKLVDFIDGEIGRPMDAAEYEEQLRDTRQLDGETAQQTRDRLAAQRAANPLVPHQVPNPPVTRARK